MNSLHESAGAAAVRILSWMTKRSRAAKPRRFRPVAEPMEVRAVLSHVALTQAVIEPIATGHGPSAVVAGTQPASDATSANAGTDLGLATAAPSGPGTGDMVVVNGQVEIQPGEIVVN
jgi:hypothetical protein